MPTGQVLVTGGNRAGTVNDYDAVLPAELWTPPVWMPPVWTPSAGTWETLAPMQVPRLYHSTAVLLPDGRVLSTGGGAGGNFESHPDYEVFSPPYLFSTSPRPQITAAPVAVQYGQAFGVTVTDPAGATIPISTLRLIRLASVTHAFDMNQRGLALIISSTVGNTINTTAPTLASGWCPPGHYLLFAVSSAGVPSEARIISITTNSCAASLSLAVAPQSGSGCATQRIVTASGQNLGATFQWTINGAAVANNSGNTLVLNQDQYTPQHRVGVSVLPTCGGSLATGGVTVTSYFPGCQPQ